jgi:hypothetical protein
LHGPSFSPVKKNLDYESITNTDASRSAQWISRIFLEQEFLA